MTDMEFPTRSTIRRMVDDELEKRNVDVIPSTIISQEIAELAGRTGSWIDAVLSVFEKYGLELEEAKHHVDARVIAEIAKEAQKNNAAEGVWEAPSVDIGELF